jgi:adenylate cyclase
MAAPAGATVRAQRSDRRMNEEHSEDKREQRRLSAILAADVVGYSRLMGADEVGTLHALKAHRREVVDPAVANHRGRIVKTTGDGVLVEFASAVDAVRCAVDVQRGMAERNEQVPAERRIELRIGINVGDIIGDGDDIFGDGVNVAARLEGMADPGGICVSRAVRDPVRDKLAFSFEDLGEISAKNIARPIHVFRVRHDAGAVRTGVSTRMVRRLIVAAVAALVVLGAGAGGWFWEARTTGNPLPRLSLVVLPFENLSGDAADNYLVEGITDDLTGDLSHIPGAFVIARASAYSYQGKAMDIRRIGQELGVRYAVQGSARRAGPMLRVNAELISTETGSQLWSDHFDQPISDLAAGQEQIVIHMRATLNISLTEIEAARSLREHPANADAFDLILQARVWDNRPRTMDTVAEALRLYKLALEKDPNAVLALAGASGKLSDYAYYGVTPREMLLRQSAKYLDRARLIAPDGETVLIDQAYLQRLQGLSTEATATSQRLVELYPNQQSGYWGLARGKIHSGEYAEAIPLIETSVRLNPRAPVIQDRYASLALCAINIGRDKEGIAWADRALVGDLPPFDRKMLLLWQAAAYARTGDHEAAKRAVDAALRINPFDTVRVQAPNAPDSPADRSVFRRIQDALRIAGLRDHAEPDADFGVASDNALHESLQGQTPTAVQGAATVRTEELVRMLGEQKPLVIDTMWRSWHLSIPGAVGLAGSDAGGDLAGTTQDRIRSKMNELTGGDQSKPIVAMGFNSENFGGRNLALRLVTLGYNNVFWYRGGREAWEAAGLPEEEMRPAAW